MSKADSHELNEILKKSPPVRNGGSDGYDDEPVNVRSPRDNNDESSPTLVQGGYCQWSTSDGKRFVPSSKTSENLTPGVYDIQQSPHVGLYFEQIPVLTTGLIRFPETNSDKVVDEIQKFWKREETFRNYKLTYKRGIILWGPPGCHARGTLIRMYDGSSKLVEKVQIGDKLMGPDSTSRIVQELKRGREEMYRITPSKGESFIVNGSHILHLVLSGSPTFRRKSRAKRAGAKDYNTVPRYQPLTMDISVKDYLKLSKWKKNLYKLKYTGVEYASGYALPVDPYIFGAWLGDGHKNIASISNKDESVVAAVYEYAAFQGVQVRVDSSSDADCPSYTMTSGNKNGKRDRNPVFSALRSLNVLYNKHIPEQYLVSSRESRLQLLAGLIDTDGHYSNGAKYEAKGHKGCYEITQKSERLAWDIVSLARSLGFLATFRKCKKTIKKLGFSDVYHRVFISGNLEQIPVRIGYKLAGSGKPNKDNLRTGIKKIESVGVDEYYGFTLDGDHLYLTADYLIHHNSGKSCTIQLIMRDVVERGGVVIKFTHPSLFIEGIRKFREIQPNTPVVVLMEDVDSILEIYNESEVLNILDGVNQIEKCVFLATTNYPEKLGARIINRPSRFDKRFKIPHPSAESRRIYFEYIIGGAEKVKALKIDLDKWVEDTDEFSIAHLKELFTAVVILGDDYDEAIEALSLMKEDKPDSHDDEARKAMGFASMASRAKKQRSNSSHKFSLAKDHFVEVDEGFMKQLEDLK